MNKPIRVQLKREKGWKLPPNTVVVSRPSKFGNPHKVSDYDMLSKHQERVSAVRDFLNDLDMGRLPFTRDDIRNELRGKNLACWCPLDDVCHADYLLKIANDGGES